MSEVKILFNETIRKGNIVELKELTFSPKKVVVIAGAGVSVYSGLPLGPSLTEFIIELACGSDVCIKILELWRNCNEAVKRIDPSYDMPLPRLEIICNCINELDIALNRQSILKGFHSFSSTKIKPNKNHSYLAQLVYEGSNILTTNFDFGIENAYEMQFKKKLKRDKKFLIPVYKSNDHEGAIYHLHGTCDDIDTLGATISKVKEGLDQEIAKVLTKILNNCCLFVAVGYGAADNFDINPFFSSLKLNSTERTMKYVSHKGTGNPLPKSLNDFKKPFSKSYIITEDTTEFLKTLCYSLKIQNKGFPNQKEYKKVPIFFDWEKEFKNSCSNPYSEKDMLINLAALRFHIGFDPEKIHPGSTEQLKTIRPTIYKNAKRSEKFKRIMLYIDEAIEHKDYYSLQENFSRPDIGPRPNYISGDYMHNLSENCNFYLSKYKNCNIQVENEDKPIINELLKLLNEYSSYTYAKFRYISNYCECLRFNYIFQARFNNIEDTDSQSKDLSTNLDISYIDGVIHALRESSLQQFYLYCRRENKIFLEKSFNLLNTSTELAKIAGFNKQIEILNERRTWYKNISQKSQ